MAGVSRWYNFGGLFLSTPPICRTGFAVLSGSVLTLLNSSLRACVRRYFKPDLKGECRATSGFGARKNLCPTTYRKLQVFGS